MTSERSRRKLEHVDVATRLGDPPGGTWLCDVHLVHDCLTEVDLEAVRLETSVCGVALRVPFVIDAMTGGAQGLGRINAALARVAARHGAAIAVGSQTAALRERDLAETYAVVRKENPAGVAIANIGADVSIADALAAVDMLEADLLQIHLNPAQELFMAEGDRSFSGSLERIAEIAGAVKVPVIVKETGSGVSGDAARTLMRTAVSGIDIGGFGGTNFVRVERLRAGSDEPSPFSGWGIPTAVSLLEVLQATDGALDVVASGGLRSGLDAAKCLALGARAVGVARPLLQALQSGGEIAVEEWLHRFLGELSTAMVLCGATDLEALRAQSVVVLGDAAAWLGARGFDPTHFARRRPS